MDSLAMLLVKKKISVRKVKKSHGVVLVGGRERKLFKGTNGGKYKTKLVAYVDAKFIRAHVVKTSCVAQTCPFFAKTSSCFAKRRRASQNVVVLRQNAVVRHQNVECLVLV